MSFFNRPEALVGLLLGGLVGAALSVFYFLIWRARYLRRIRLESVQRSQAVKDARFLGSPVDLVVFDGLDRGEPERLVFVEVKTGGAGLSNRERQLKAVIQARRVVWVEIRG